METCKTGARSVGGLRCIFIHSLWTEWNYICKDLLSLAWLPEQGIIKKDSPEILLDKVKFVLWKAGKGFLTLKTTPAMAAWNRLPHPLIPNTEIRRSKIDRWFWVFRRQWVGIWTPAVFQGAQRKELGVWGLRFVRSEGSVGHTSHALGDINSQDWSTE